jgi:hypothetical protein
MSIALFAPYGSVSKETGFLVALGKFLGSRGYGVVNLRCNGVLSECGRDALNGTKRSLSSCINCINDNEVATNWAGVPSIELSPYLNFSEYEQYKDLISGLSQLDKDRFQVHGIKLSSLIGTSSSEDSSEAVKEFDKRFVTTSRLISAFSQILATRRLDAILSIGSEDLLLKTFLSVVANRELTCFIFKWDSQKMLMKITTQKGSQAYTSELFFDDVSSMRQNVESWPEQVQKEFLSIEQFMGITQQQLSLPMV